MLLSGGTSALEKRRWPGEGISKGRRGRGTIDKISPGKEKRGGNLILSGRRKRSLKNRAR